MGNIKGIKQVEISQLLPYANNAKVHTDEQLEKIADSIKEFGFLTPCVIDTDNNVIAGHGRILAAKKLGLSSVPCVYVEGLTEAQRKAYILADNRLGEFAEWDQLLVNAELIDIDSLGLDVSLTGFELSDHFWGNAEGKSNEEYNEFTEKFEPKLTTDDCYTPPNIYEVVKNWAIKRYNLEGRKIIRPFYPGGDYQNEKYPADCVVIDNPPFSIMAEIIKFYEEKKIDYFLFSQNVTLFGSAGGKVHYVPIGISIIYENGAKVCTGFVTSMGEYLVEASPELYKLIDEQNDINIKAQTKDIPKYAYPNHVLTPSMCTKFSKYGVDFKVRAESADFLRGLDSQKEQGKTIFGAGFLLSDSAAAEKAAAEKAAAEIWTLSDREKAIIEMLNEREKHNGE